MPLHEYLYVDTRRLDSYLEQFAAPVAYDKVPTWKAGISLKGPEAQVSQDRFPRTRTMHERVELLLEHLEKTDQMSNGRAGPGASDDDSSDNPKPFRMETCVATRAFLASRPAPTDRDSEMALWFSEPLGQGIGSLLLMEDFAGDDRPAQFRVGTPASALVHLIDEMQEELRATILGPDETQRRKVQDAIRLPGVTEVLRQLGARVGSHRQIATLYRVRALFGEGYDLNNPRNMALGTIGYPIFIRDA